MIQWDYLKTAPGSFNLFDRSSFKVLSGECWGVQESVHSLQLPEAGEILVIWIKSNRDEHHDVAIEPDFTIHTSFAHF